MENQTIVLRKQRDFGDVFNATFSFIKQEFKTLGQCVLFYILPFGLLNCAGIVWYMYKIFSIVGNMSDPSMINSNPFSIIGMMLGVYLVLIITSIIGFTMLTGIVYSYMAIYLERGHGKFTHTDVLKKTAEVFFPVLGTGILVNIMVGVGFVFCILPGIYLGVSLSLIFAALIIERKGFSEAISRTFSLTHKEWWWTFLLVLTITIIIIAIMYGFMLVAMVVGLGGVLMHTPNESEVSQTLGITMTIFYGLVVLLSYGLTVIPMIMMGFQYFSLVEKTERPSLAEKINQIS